MAKALDLFVDKTLADVIRRREEESDFEPAKDRQECASWWVRSGEMSACKRYAAAVGNLERNDRRLQMARGLCREQQFVRALCLGKIRRDGSGALRRVKPGSTHAAPELYWQVRIESNNRASPVVDVVVPDPDPVKRKAGVGTVYEHKSIYAPHYLARHDDLRKQVRSDAADVLLKARWSRRSDSIVPPSYRHELVYSLEDAPSDPVVLDRMRQFIVRTAQGMGVRAHVLSFAEA